MFPKKTLLFFIAAMHGFVIAQHTGVDQTEKDYLKFKETLQEEFEKITPDTSFTPEKYTLHPASIPDWFYNMPPSDDQNIYAIGISDPGMEEQQAIELATLRAKSVAALLWNPKIARLADNFTDEREKGSNGVVSSKYINYYRIIASLAVMEDQIETVDQFFTSFDEVIVLLKLNLFINDISPKDTITATSNIYQAEIQKHNYFEMEEMWQMKGNCISFNSERIKEYSYSFKAVNNLAEITSYYNQSKLDFPYFNFRYQGNNVEPLVLPENTISGKLNLGLWKGLLESLLQNIILHGQGTSVTIKQVGDAYTSRTQNLSREVTESSNSFRIKNLQISSNKLYLNLEKLEKPYSN
jgi:hypothetical protein